MGCLRLSYYPSFEVLKGGFAKELTSKKSVLNLRRVYFYGFNGQEKDDEVYGEGNSTTAEFWQYDSRLGRRWNIDPKPNASISGYACFANSSILFSDPYGDTIKVYGPKKDQWMLVGYLQTLTNDKLTLKKGCVLIKEKGGSQLTKDEKLPLGTEFISELINHEGVVELWPVTETPYTKSNNARNLDSQQDNMHNGVGAKRTRVHFDTTKESTYLTKNNKTGKAELTTVKRERTLAHELIHAYYMLMGANYRGENTVKHKFTDEKGNTYIQTIPQEESETVGLSGDRKYTENKIAKEKKWGMRLKY